MRNRLTSLVCLAAFAAATHAPAQEPPEAPLNVIDWLDGQALQPTALSVEEPGVVTSGNVPSVTVRPLGTAAPKRVGLAPPSVTGLPDTLWSGSDGAALARSIADMPDLRLPALQSLFYTILLAEAQPPTGRVAAFDLARIDALVGLGALDPALALLEQAGPETSQAHFARYMDMSLLAGTPQRACSTLRARPALSPGKAHEVYCIARAGDWSTAALQLGTARVLGLIDAPTVAALERFLDPDLFEGEPPLPVPTQPDALMFRLFEANGTPVPTRSWPVVYANADLADTAGWKPQIEAAERLARTGAVPDNRLLGLYTQRRPAASGGVWDRVAALQRFETALGTGSPAAVSKTLPEAWRAMQATRLTVPFAALFADDLAVMTLSGRTADVAFDVLLLSPDYERAAQVFPTRALRRPDLAAVAAGEIPANLQAQGTAGAVLAAFDGGAPDPRIVIRAQGGALGAALLDALALTLEGAEGDVARLTSGLATLRALGLEDVARRAALQVMLLEDT
ncbi:hypothetical protein [uncultured Tateyamaria sp.]|uniref:hypothetical protein n=1 Tax=uncultured Tateyamaria sp. TaxID=455651 RepID=UPI0026206434|nr:hypothetical protein [uncultured Tateyamaria sp.]